MLLCLTLSSFSAWGRDGHGIVGSVAQQFLTPKAQKKVDSLLAKGETLASVSTWADAVRKDPEFAYTKVLHYAPTGYTKKGETCGFNDQRDCPDGKCIVGAIGTFTDKFKCPAKAKPSIASFFRRQRPQRRRRRPDPTKRPQVKPTEGKEASPYEALKFVVHFVGDIAQPLHMCHRDRGGNEFMVNWKGQQVKFHAAWDSQLVEQRVEDVSGSNEKYVDYLVESLTTGQFKENAASWIANTDLTSKTPSGNSKTVVQWGMDSEKLNCEVVWGPVDDNQSQDISGDYYKSLAPIIDMQLAKAGYRLANWLNLAFDC